MSFYYAFYLRKYIYYAACIFLILLSAFTASRKALVVLLLGLLYLLFMKNKSKKIIRTFLLIVTVGTVVYFILQLPMFDTLMLRMTEFFDFFSNDGGADNSTIERSNMISLGWDLFMKRPLTGYGYDSFRYFLAKDTGRYTYSHNNFIEMLVNGGIIAFLSYYGMYVYCFIKLFRISDTTSILLVTLLLAQLIGDFAVVSYYSKITYVFFAICFAYIRLNDKEKINKSV
ncbi:O-antigen ligase family protein [Paenibacillus lycopersici]